MLNTYDLNKAQVILHLMRNGILAKIQNDAITLKPSKIDEAQTLVDKMYFNMPDLLPTQFYWLLATTGLEQVIDTLLENLRQTDLQKYAMYQGFLKGARYYEFSKAIAILTQAEPIIAQAYPDLDLSIPTLKSLWLEAAKF